MKNSNLNEKLNALKSLLNEGLAAEELDKIDAEVAKDADVAEHMDKSEEVEAPKEEEKEEPKAEEEVHEEHPEEAPVEEKHEEQPEEIKKSISDIAADVVKQESEVKAPVPSTDVALPKGTLEVQQEPKAEEKTKKDDKDEAEEKKTANAALDVLKGMLELHGNADNSISVSVVGSNDGKKLVIPPMSDEEYEALKAEFHGEEQPEEIKKSISDIAADMTQKSSIASDVEVEPVPNADVVLPEGTLEVQQEPTDEEEVHEEHPEEAPVEEKHEEEAIKLDEAIENLNNLIMSINDPSEITSDMMAQRNSIKSDVEVEPVPNADVVLPEGTLEVQQEPKAEEEVHEEQPEEAQQEPKAEEKHEEVHEEQPEETPAEEKQEEEVETPKEEEKEEPKAEEDPTKECESLKDVVKCGSEKFDTEEQKEGLKERMAILLAHENGDLMYEEYNRLVSEAASLKSAICKKYAIISNNRTNDLLEGMKIAEAKIASNKKDMFKKLNEQIAINAAKKSSDRKST